jgi:hypothetical protein
VRLFLTVVFGAALSFAIAFALVYAVFYWWPCRDTESSCRLGYILGYGAIMAYAPLATLVFAITAWRAGNERAVSLAALALLAPIAAFLFYGVLLYGVADVTRDWAGFLQVITAPALIVVIQWAVLRAHLVHRVMPA